MSTTTEKGVMGPKRGSTLLLARQAGTRGSGSGRGDLGHNMGLGHSGEPGSEHVQR